MQPKGTESVQEQAGREPCVLQRGRDTSVLNAEEYVALCSLQDFELVEVLDAIMLLQGESRAIIRAYLAHTEEDNAGL